MDKFCDFVRLVLFLSLLQLFVEKLLTHSLDKFQLAGEDYGIREKLNQKRLTKEKAFATIQTDQPSV